MAGHAVIVDPHVQWAKDAISAKAAEKAAVLGNATSGVESIDPPNADSGFVQSFQFGAVYYTEAAGAHEVNGEIAEKYKRLGGPGAYLGKIAPLGYPISDEQSANDNAGRFSDFQHGSIFWHKRTGPMLVHEVLRPAYQAVGRETGSLGYPTTDTYPWRTQNPADSNLVWGLFENGCIASPPNGAAKVCGLSDTATILANDLKALVRHIADKKIHAQDNNVGLQPQVDIVSVSDWQHSLDASGRRIISYRLYAFKDMGVLPDLDIHIRFEIQFNWKSDPSFFDGAVQTLIALFPQDLGVDNPRIESVTEVGIPIAFGSQNFGVGDSNSIADIPVNLPGAQPPVRVILDMIVTPAGDLRLFTNPFGLGRGGSFGPEVQQQLDSKVADLLAS